MGIFKMFSSSVGDRCTCSCHSPSLGSLEMMTPNYKLPNPNPKNYRFNKVLRIGECLILDITYPDCTNYEGRKILLYQNVGLSDLINQGSIDPHFSDNKKYLSPIARFVPNDDGWKMAETLAKQLEKDSQDGEKPDMPCL